MLIMVNYTLIDYTHKHDAENWILTLYCTSYFLISNAITKKDHH